MQGFSWPFGRRDFIYFEGVAPLDSAQVLFIIWGVYLARLHLTNTTYCKLGVLPIRLPTCGVVIGVGEGPTPTETVISRRLKCQQRTWPSVEICTISTWPEKKTLVNCCAVRVSSTTGNIKVSDFLVILQVSQFHRSHRSTPRRPNRGPLRATVLHFGDRDFPKGMGVDRQYQISKDEKKNLWQLIFLWSKARDAF